jgi:hypothetical protein
MTLDHTEPRHRRPGLRGVSWSLALVFAVALFGAVVAAAKSTAVPQNTAPPTISGNAREGETLSASTGTWDNSPTKFAYQWQRCSSSGTGCADVTGAQDRSYTAASADVDHTLRVVVTASNADGQSTSESKTTDMISSKADPVNTAKPSVSGTAKVGEELTADPGSWTGGVKSFAFQWQRCLPGGTGCTDVSGATGKTYGVRAADVGKVLQVVVTASNSSGTTDATSGTTATVPSTATSPPIVRHGNRAPTIAFLSLRHVGRVGVYARFRVCDDSRKQVLVIQHDAKSRVLGYTRRFAVTPLSCRTASRHWVPAARFRTPGRLVVTLRAIDKSGASSRTVTRALRF